MNPLKKASLCLAVAAAVAPIGISAASAAPAQDVKPPTQSLWCDWHWSTLEGKGASHALAGTALANQFSEWKAMATMQPYYYSMSTGGEIDVSYQYYPNSVEIMSVTLTRVVGYQTCK